MSTIAHNITWLYSLHMLEAARQDVNLQLLCISIAPSPQDADKIDQPSDAMTAEEFHVFMDVDSIMVSPQMRLSVTQYPRKLTSLPDSEK